MDAFNNLGTIGVEEEFFAVDFETLEPAPASDLLLSNPPDELKDNIDTELFKFVIETNIDTAWSLSEVKDEIIAKRRALKEYAHSYGYEILAAGLHPTARWHQESHIEKKRYREQLNRLQYPQNRNITAGLHIHIGVDDPDKAVWISDEIRMYLPLLLSLGANSPFWCGRKTGLMSTRGVIFENLPNTGIPSEFSSWRKFKSLESRMVKEGFIKDRGELWWDVRPHSEYGTVEVRIPDSQTNYEKSFEFIALVYSLVLRLSKLYEKGNKKTDIRREIIDQNKWRAIRYGKETTFLKPDSGTIDVKNMLDNLLDTLDIDEYISTLFNDTGAEKQINIYNKSGFKEVLRLLRI